MSKMFEFPMEFTFPISGIPVEKMHGLQVSSHILTELQKTNSESMNYKCFRIVFPEVEKCLNFNCFCDIHNFEKNAFMNCMNYNGFRVVLGAKFQNLLQNIRDFKIFSQCAPEVSNCIYL